METEKTETSLVIEVETTDAERLAAVSAASRRLACYSGGFVPALADNNSLVIRASRHDLNSHGCSHEADWTFFGRVFFQEALRRTHSFEMAFDQARVAVAERVAAENFAASEPQIALGNGIRVARRAVEGRLEGGGISLP